MKGRRGWCIEDEVDLSRFLDIDIQHKEKINSGFVGLRRAFCIHAPGVKVRRGSVEAVDVPWPLEALLVIALLVECQGNAKPRMAAHKYLTLLRYRLFTVSDTDHDLTCNLIARAGMYELVFICFRSRSRKMLVSIYGIGIVKPTWTNLFMRR